jgi:hypothetical protein
MTIWRMNITCWISKSTNTHLEYVIPTYCIPLQQWLQERTSVLCYTHIFFLFRLPETE